MKQVIVFAAAILSAAAIVGCSTGGNVESEKSAILHVILNDMSYTLSGDVEGSLVDFPTDRNLLFVEGGQIVRGTRDSARIVAKETFAKVRYTVMRNLDPPQINVSSDCRMAWCVLRQEIGFRYKQPAGFVKGDTAIYTKLVAMEKDGGKWVIVASAVTKEKGD